MHGNWTGESQIPIIVDRRVLRSLDILHISAVERLATPHWRHSILPPLATSDEFAVH